MTHLRLCALALVAATSMTACTRPRLTGVAAVVGADVATQLPREVFEFVDVLPSSIKGFGFVDFGAPLEQLLDFGPDSKPLIDDLVEMAQRRWGIDARRSRGIGFAVVGEELVLVGDLGAAGQLPTSPAFTTARVGKLTVVGKQAAVSAFTAAKPDLAKANLPWVRSALRHAIGQAAFFTMPASALPPSTDPEDAKLAAALEWATVVIGKTGGAAHLTAKPGQAATLRAPIDQGLAAAKGVLGPLANMPGDGIESFFQRLAARHWGAAFLNSVRVDTVGEVVSVGLPWHAPVMPERQSAPPLSERVVAHDEWAVMQLDFGNPLAQLLVSVTDVLPTPLSRNAIAGELIAELSRAANLPAMDPRGVTVSAGGMAALASVYGAKPAIQGGIFNLMGGELRAAGTPWGYVATSAGWIRTLEDALDTPASGMSLAQSSRFADQRHANMRLLVDLTRLPTMAKVMLADVPIVTVELMATATRFEADIVAKPGQAGQVQKLIGIFKDAMAGELGNKYQTRKTLPVSEELVAIMAHHQIMMLDKVLTPKVSGDRLSFSYEVSPQAQRGMWVGALTGALAGGVAYFTIGKDVSTSPVPAPAAIAQ